MPTPIEGVCLLDILTLSVALQIGLSKAKHNLPLGNQVEVNQVETISNEYLKKEFIVETASTIDEPKRTFRVVYKPTERATSNFSWGWCTYYVSTKRPISWSGNAGMWAINSRALGYEVGNIPKPGSIMVEHIGRVGHVSYVESVDESSFTVSEMNYTGFGVVSSRTLHLTHRAEFIY